MEKDLRKLFDESYSLVTRKMSENPNWKREAKKTIEEKFYHKWGFIKISPKSLTLEELSNLAISIGIVSPNEIDSSVYSVEEIENKLCCRLDPLLPGSNLVVRSKKRKGRSVKYYLDDLRLIGF